MLTVENLTRGPEHPARLLRDAARRLRGQDHALPPAVSTALAKWLESHATAAERTLTYGSALDLPGTWDCGDCYEPLWECKHGTGDTLAAAAAVVAELPAAVPAGGGPER